MKWVVGLVILLLGAGITYWYATAPAKPPLALQFVGKQLSCVDKLNLHLGTMKIMSDDAGKTLNVLLEDGSYTLTYAGSEESYRNGQGQTLAFGSDVSFSGFFGDKHGHCA